MFNAKDNQADHDGAASEPAFGDADAAVVNPSDDNSDYNTPASDSTLPSVTSPVDNGVPNNDKASSDFDAHSGFTAGQSSASNSSDDLLDIKQQALRQLGPLVNHLNQTPGEKFRVTMMMIQANDDQSLVKDAYEAARQITDNKERAQALLDVINEINYFTQKSQAKAET